MLPAEIEPFAQHHITALKEVQDTLQSVRNSFDSPVGGITVEELEKNLQQLKDAQRALYRFERCMVDEHKMKARLEDRVRTCRLEHRDK